MRRDFADPGDWVQVERVILEGGARAAGVPEDTAALPLLARIKGFALGEAGIGEDVEIETVIGRRITGRLVAIEPRYGHDFGGPVPELARAALEARALIEGRGAR